MALLLATSSLAALPTPAAASTRPMPAVTRTAVGPCAAPTMVDAQDPKARQDPKQKPGKKPAKPT